jgi:hypothetical protein
VDHWLNVLATDPGLGEVAVNLPRHNGAKDNTEENQERNIYRLKQTDRKALKKVALHDERSVILAGNPLLFNAFVFGRGYTGRSKT